MKNETSITILLITIIVIFIIGIRIGIDCIQKQAIESGHAHRVIEGDKAVFEWYPPCNKESLK